MVPLFAARGWRRRNPTISLPETYAVALVVMLLSMLCWGSWANAMKLCPGFRFQLFYWDYAAGLVQAARFACAAAAISVTRCGAQNSMPRRAEVETLLAARTH